jgi:hypothetical protein
VNGEDGLNDSEEDSNWNGAWEVGLGETDPNNPDTDNDNITDKDEIDGWYVKIFWERNPTDTKGIPDPYHVTSDPLDSDTDNDGVEDGVERAELADPTISDTDGDTFVDGNEYELGSTISGRESGIPSMTKDIDTSTSWDPIKIGPVTVAYKLVSNIDVEIWGQDNAGVKNIYVEVFSPNWFGGKKGEETQAGSYFHKNFKFDFNLESTVTEIWNGWDVYIKVTDINENYGYQKEHIKSGIQTLIDFVVENLANLANAIQQWILDRITQIINIVLGPILDAIETFNSFIIKQIENLGKLFNGEDSTFNLLSGLLNNPIMMFVLAIPAVILGVYVLL